MNSAPNKREPFYSPIHQAALEGNVKAIHQWCKQLPSCVNYQTLSGLTPLMIACQNGHPEAVQALLVHDADVNLVQFKTQKVALRFATSKKIKLSLLSKAEHDYHHKALPLHKAVLKDNLNQAKQAIKNGAEINGYDARGLTPLMLACKQNYYNMVVFLLDNGADVSLCKLDTSRRKVVGALELSKDKAITKRLKAHANCTRTPLHQAALKGHVKRLRNILNKTKEWRINAKNGDKETAIFSAIRGQQTKALKYLINKGASIIKKSTQGYSILSYAKWLKIHDQITPDFYEVVRQLVGLPKSAVQSISLTLFKMIDNALNRAQKQGKNLLVILGEVHNDSAINQVRKKVYRYISELGIKRAYEEYPSTDYEHHKFEQMVECEFHMLVTPIDDGRQYDTKDDDFEIRNDKMIDRLLEVNESGVFTTGAHHLLGMHQRKQLNKKYYILPINLAPLHREDDIDNTHYEAFATDKQKNVQVSRNGRATSVTKPLKFWNPSKPKGL